MNNVTLYIAILHNATHYSVLAQAAAGFSAAISQRLAGMAEQNAKIAELLFEEALSGSETIQPITLFAFDVDFEREPDCYIGDVLDRVIEAEEYLCSIFKQYGMGGFENIAFYRVNDFLAYKKGVEDGSIFGDVGRRVDFICTACGYIYSDITADDYKYMPQSCPCCNSERAAFIRRPYNVGW